MNSTDAQYYLVRCLQERTVLERRMWEQLEPLEDTLYEALYSGRVKDAQTLIPDLCATREDWTQALVELENDIAALVLEYPELAQARPIVYYWR
jgi:hypothetical protein